MGRDHEDWPEVEEHQPGQSDGRTEAPKLVKPVPRLRDQQQYTDHPLSHSGIEDEFMDAENDNVSLTDDNASQSGSIHQKRNHSLNTHF